MLATPNHATLRDVIKYGKTQKSLKEYPMPTSRSKAFEETWMQRTHTAIVPKMQMSNTMATHVFRERLDIRSGLD